MAKITIEVIFSALSGAIFGSTVYNCVGYQYYIQADNPTAAALAFVGIVSLMFIIANVRPPFLCFYIHVHSTRSHVLT